MMLIIQRKIDEIELMEPFLNGRNYIYKEETEEGVKYRYFISEYWTSKQRQANNIHEISYRACFKPQLPNFFITKLTKEGDWIYDPFMGRGTTLVEGALLGRNVIGNDINPLSKILTEPRLIPPSLERVVNRLEEINLEKNIDVSKEDLFMFFSEKTLIQIVNLKNYLLEKEKTNSLDLIDKWIRMVATNRLTGHSKGFFSVYTLPPNQAVSRERQLLINKKRNQKPEDKNIKELIIKKTRHLLRDLKKEDFEREIQYKLMINPADKTPEIPNEFVKLIVTSPPFLDVVNYSKDNWLRCWFNGIDVKKVEDKMLLCRTLKCWEYGMEKVFYEMFRVLKKGGFIAFEVGEVRNGKIKLDHSVVKIGKKVGLRYLGTLINLQEFTKTSNIWGIENNKKGTNTNRLVIFLKEI
ncbi:DNA methyltransferase [Persephonella sp.]